MARLALSIAFSVVLALAILGVGGALFLIPHSDPSFDFYLQVGGGIAIGMLAAMLGIVIPGQIRKGRS